MDLCYALDPVVQGLALLLRITNTSHSLLGNSKYFPIAEVSLLCAASCTYIQYTALEWCVQFRAGQEGQI